ncbi:MAG: phage adaptor protein [Planctomycetota bacterium]|jgi:hypothetical protein
MATFGTLWQEVRKGTGDRDDIDTEIKSSFNDAIVDISLMFPIREILTNAVLTTDTNVNKYALEDAVLDVVSVRNNTDAVPLTKGDWYEFDSLDYGDTTKTGTPTRWFVDGNDLTVYADTPDGTGFEISYRYIKRATDLVDDADLFSLPREWERPTKLLAKSYVFELLGQRNEAVAAFQQMTAVVSGRKSVGYWEKVYSKTASVDFSTGYAGDEL